MQTSPEVVPLNCFSKTFDLLPLSSSWQIISSFPQSLQMQRCLSSTKTGSWVRRMLPWRVWVEETPNHRVSPGPGRVGPASHLRLSGLMWLTVWCVWTLFLITLGIVIPITLLWFHQSRVQMGCSGELHSGHPQGRQLHCKSFQF